MRNLNLHSATDLSFFTLPKVIAIFVSSRILYLHHIDNTFILAAVAIASWNNLSDSSFPYSLKKSLFTLPKEMLTLISFLSSSQPKQMLVESL
ncbi:hypothetical protein [Lysinibacillus fusiformis]|uniref:hypothetical protein n=1 Tax=Lysinibacillus fusiformis TaxID=28031 RepID=UPI0015E071B1|nr:hypothetical protein [Lysinibacillus fusiformis]